MLGLASKCLSHPEMALSSIAPVQVAFVFSGPSEDELVICDNAIQCSLVGLGGYVVLESRNVSDSVRITRQLSQSRHPTSQGE